MPSLAPVMGRVRHHAMAVCALRSGPVPVAAMLRSGVAIGSTFVLLVAFGRAEAAAVAALFTNFLCLADKAEHLNTRVWVQVVGAVMFVALGALGMLVTGNPPLILVTVFAVALFAGFVHGTTPGVEALPRFALSCLIVESFVPLDGADALAGALLGAVIAVAIVLLDDYARNGRRGRHAALMRANVAYPSPRFSMIYGCAVAVAIVIGQVWGEARPYWVAITTLVVMQPDRRANTVRVAQRFLGTLAGVVLAFVAVRATPDAARPAMLVVLILSLPFAWPFGFDRNYGLGVAIISTWVLLLIDSALPSADLAMPLFAARLSDTAIGCAIALVGSFAVFEARDEATG